ncbi:hypothetical protein Sa4125_35700 [Aureimonas sp. SA4125]|uniref:hypothetical protein n=1 Tax=Aureimonas sp. SA4125 TaxID=2826993 RepID=UPI001CC3E603|nr:hypothetical protein [Aureimonas sp. SA4125]BDA86028.1 hypothetical protein Sa4125_35700 [Aureimonas sp. SA4125]
MLTDFPRGFGFDPTVMGERAAGYVAGRRSRLAPGMTMTPVLPVVLVDDELLPVNPQDESDNAPAERTSQSPVVTAALVGVLLAGAGYFVGFH